MSGGSNPSSTGKKPSFVVAATVAAGLEVVRKTASDMSLTAMNAKVVTARAGEAALGFLPLTQFVTELSDNSMESVAKLNQKAHHISRMAIDELRLRQMSDGVNRAYKHLQEQGAETANIHHMVKRFNDDLSSLESKFDQEFLDFISLLESLRKQVKSARFIVANCRIEAASTGSFRGSLEAVADSLEQASQVIERHVVECQGLIKQCDLRV